MRAHPRRVWKSPEPGPGRPKRDRQITKDATHFRSILYAYPYWNRHTLLSPLFFIFIVTFLVFLPSG